MCRGLKFIRQIGHQRGQLLELHQGTVLLGLQFFVGTELFGDGMEVCHLESGTTLFYRNSCDAFQTADEQLLTAVGKCEVFQDAD